MQIRDFGILDSKYQGKLPQTEKHKNIFKKKQKNPLKK